MLIASRSLLGSDKPRTEKTPARKKSIGSRSDPDPCRSLERMASELNISELS
uniref:Uncharacterized protein n=1 Tax=Bursaphelenchus xylophilus TaxID=6326 RepID=A0A1I7SI21_BURXY